MPLIFDNVCIMLVFQPHPGVAQGPARLRDAGMTNKIQVLGKHPNSCNKSTCAVCVVKKNLHYHEKVLHL